MKIKSKINYNLKDLKEADERLAERWKKNKIELHFNNNNKILVVGTLNYINLINKLGTKNIFAIDTEKKPKFLRSALFNHIKFKKTNLKKIYFKDNTFDFIFCNGILSHLNNWNKLLKDFFRVLKPEGKLWINVFGYSNFRKMPMSINRKMSKADVNKLTNILAIEKWNIQKIKYIENNFFWKKRILFKKKNLELKIKKIGFKNIKFCPRGIETDLSEQVYKNNKLKKLFNHGDLRYLITK